MVFNEEVGLVKERKVNYSPFEQHGGVIYKESCNNEAIMKQSIYWRKKTKGKISNGSPS